MSADEEAIAQELAAYVRREGEARERDKPITRDVDLFAFGYIDSAGVVALIAWLEEHFKVVLTEDELFDDDFATITGIARIIANAIRRSPSGL